ncbi:hypothetical protein TNCV_2206251 [Trichonephila clavipes]|uniref:Uncharacterized protein n=1 Tax=Trichonephila clavipes TaxID=2585209 RepID=A0A8X6VA98_TRICX|nr:hypothetical protein TNCV_2206251 [Trichonephila clavipes]
MVASGVRLGSKGASEIVHQHTGRLMCEIASMNVFICDGLNKSPTATCNLPNDYPEVLAYDFFLLGIHKEQAFGRKGIIDSMGVLRQKLRGRGSRVVKVSDRGCPCHEFEPSTTKDPPCREAMQVKCVESSNVLPLAWCVS